MGDLVRHHPLEARLGALEALPASVGVSVEPYVAMVDVRSIPPAGANTWAEHEGGRAIWLGPDEWLFTGETETPQELEARARAFAVLNEGSAVDVSVVDVSAQRITLRLTGSRVREVLAKGCSIDLHPRVFTAGRSAQTTLGQAGIVLLALGEDDFLVLVRSSFAGYLADWLLDASLEYV